MENRLRQRCAHRRASPIPRLPAASPERDRTPRARWAGWSATTGEMITMVETAAAHAVRDVTIVDRASGVDPRRGLIDSGRPFGVVVDGGRPVWLATPTMLWPAWTVAGSASLAAVEAALPPLAPGLVVADGPRVIGVLTAPAVVRWRAGASRDGTGRKAGLAVGEPVARIGSLDLWCGCGVHNAALPWFDPHETRCAGGNHLLVPDYRRA